MAAVRLPLTIFLFLFLLLILPLPLHVLSLSDNEALLRFKKSLAHSDALRSWVPGSNPCQPPWAGVVCANGIVTGLLLGNMGLSGDIDVDALVDIRGLRTISLTNNSFSGPLPPFNRLRSLKGLFLSGNKFSGEIASAYFTSMQNVKKLWLSQNRFTGRIPESLSRLSHLIELHVDDNQFSGPIPKNLPPTLQSLGLSNNKLAGEIPGTLAKFKAEAFKGNEGLCGQPLAKDCEKAAKALKPPPSPSSSPSPSQPPPTPTPTPTLPPPIPVPEKSKPSNAPKFVMLAALALLTVALLVFVSRSKLRSESRQKEDFRILGKENINEVVEVQVSGTSRKAQESTKKSTGSGRKPAQTVRSGMNDLVIINEDKGTFGMPDLMRAAAEVLGNGGLGSAYKAVMANGLSVVVKRMREMNRLGRDSFDAEIRKIGSVRHRNILTPLAYHYRKDEKLLVSEHVSNGSLLYVLHGDRGISHSELTWATRLKIIQGIASGMDFLHTEFSNLDLPHGNLKSSNILLDGDYVPLLTDYALQPLVNVAQASQAMFAYRAPECLEDQQQISPKCDVYCLGIVILEILTGKFPAQYLSNGKGGTDIVQWVKSAIEEDRETELIDPEIAEEASEEEIRRLIRIAADCTVTDPQNRLHMKEAVRRIQELKE